MAESASSFSKRLTLLKEEIEKISVDVSRSEEVQIIAVSKKKTVDAILDAYEVGQRHFGENYVQELVEKSKDRRLQG